MESFVTNLKSGSCIIVKDGELIRARVVVNGVVQGVGFRPFIYLLANEHRLRGFVLNSTEGVVIEVEGSSANLQEFLNNITLKAPVHAVIEKIKIDFLQPLGYHSFIIQESQEEKDKSVLIPPDLSICQDCLNELFDSQDRRYHYPFISCTNCGPRFTIIKNIPYDRPKTTMAVFKMCKTCQEEYYNPGNRRFHAQLNACFACGPQVWLVDTNNKKAEGEEAIRIACQLLKQGKIVAIKGLGGFHLACDATSENSVVLLRKRKHRPNKPFAIMSLDTETVASYCYLSNAQRQLLESPKRPIVLLQRKPYSAISDKVAPNNPYLGVMLPYTPLHYLLLEKTKDNGIPALVMTSGNISEEPIVISNQEALERLGSLADAFLIHNRDIHTRCDDSVIRVFEEKELIIRRSRGYAPFPIILNFKTRPVLACGAHLKNTFCLTKENYAFLSQHIGDMENLETLNFFKENIEYFKKLFQILPEVIAYDLHPDYLSTKYALELKLQSTSGLQFVPVQHHHAHIASCMAENGLEGRVIGVAFDGSGYGEDGHVWGGEFLVCDYQDFKRCAHLEYVVLPGGEAAIRRPYRMAISYLSRFPRSMIAKLELFGRIDPNELNIINKQIKTGINSPFTSSCGRLFDAVSSLLGVCDVVTYEGQAAIELEMLADEAVTEAYYWPLKTKNFPIIIDQYHIFRDIISDLESGVPICIISAKFHNALAEVVFRVCSMIRKKENINKVVLSGGVFQNIYLLRRTLSRLQEKGFITYIHHQVPCNDGGIALGQAVIASVKTTRDKSMKKVCA